MAKKEKKAPDPPAGVPAWMATFSDLVTLLLTFFVMLMAMASFDDPAKANSVIQSLRDKFGADAFDERLNGVGEGEAMAEMSAADVDVSPLLARLQAGFREKLSRQITAMDAEQSELVVQIEDPAFFREGASEVHPNAFGTLADLGALLATEPTVTVEVRGYAEPDEAADPDRLAAARAIAVIGRLRGQVDGTRLSASVYGSAPVDPMKGTKGWSRRIGLVLRTETPAGRAGLNDLSEGSHGQ
jgi:chemotaxis protein MotB